MDERRDTPAGSAGSAEGDPGTTREGPGYIRRILRSETFLITEHLLRLSSEARKRRFNHDVTDEYVMAYAGHAADYGNLTYGYVNDGDIRAVAELRRSPELGELSAEVAFSVEPEFANQGIATQLMGRIIRSARNRGIRHLILVCLAENRKMQAIARRYGADLHVDEGSIIADIVPKRPDYASIASELVDDRFAIMHAALNMQMRIAKFGETEEH